MELKPRNLVAKNARKYNKAAIHRDRKKDYRRRREKHAKSVDQTA